MHPYTSRARFSTASTRGQRVKQTAGGRPAATPPTRPTLRPIALLDSTGSCCLATISRSGLETQSWYSHTIGTRTSAGSTTGVSGCRFRHAAVEAAVVVLYHLRQLLHHHQHVLHLRVVLRHRSLPLHK